eukprot:TRINITY_DN1478_c0_g1_i3.p2 TRINITY_DN1478_c0_g1~~TRINITY_DN1478_c0_g1_i3.p2  ORF type:complete len:395 (-),score=84.24 TRINITY_DN1478_c0_g1_i3:1359-2543(-)
MSTERLLTTVGCSCLVTLALVVVISHPSDPSNAPVDAYSSTTALISQPVLQTPMPSWSGTAESPRKNVFVFGHSPTPDADSIGSSIGLAELMHITPVCPGNVSDCFMPNVRKFLDLYGPHGKDSTLPSLESVYRPGDQLVTVDFHIKPQLPAWLNQSTAEVVASLDTHEFDAEQALDVKQMWLQVPQAIATSTMIAFMFFERGLTPSKFAAHMLLAGVIDDTASLNPISGFTEADKQAASRLAHIAGVTDLETFGETAFQLKSSKVVTAPIKDVLQMDMKLFQFNGKKLVWGTVESTKKNGDKLLARKGLEQAADQVRQLHKADYAIFSIVDVLDQSTSATRLLTGDAASRALVQKAFPLAHASSSNDASGFIQSAGCTCISRAQYIPIVKRFI